MCNGSLMGVLWVCAMSVQWVCIGRAIHHRVALIREHILVREGILGIGCVMKSYTTAMLMPPPVFDPIKVVRESFSSCGFEFVLLCFSPRIPCHVCTFLHYKPCDANSV
jgi:hypothetical protein